MKNNLTSLVLTIVRHGQTDANKDQLIHGHFDTKLNETGKKQATKAGKALKQVKFDKAISSDLSRAKTTCRLILGQNSASAIKEIVEDPRIRERNFGVYENANYSEFEDKVKECGFERWIDYTPNNGESHEDIHNRARTFITDVIEQGSKMEQENPSILIVTHGGLIRELLNILFDEMGCEPPPGGEFGDHHRSKMGSIRNTSWSRFEFSLWGEYINTLKCHTLCDVSHLDT